MAPGSSWSPGNGPGAETRLGFQESGSAEISRHEASEKRKGKP